MKYRIFATVLLVAVLASVFLFTNPTLVQSNSAASTTAPVTQDPAAHNPENTALTGMKIN